MGQIINPDNPTYDEARKILNSMIDKRPGVIAQCASVEDVVRAVQFGCDRDLEIAIRDGGHSVAGKGLTDGGLVIDMRRMNAASVDPQARTVTIAGGATMSHLDRATEPYGLATTGGRVSTTGVGGYTLGGGDSPSARQAIELVDSALPDSRMVMMPGQQHIAMDMNPELFLGEVLPFLLER